MSVAPDVIDLFLACASASPDHPAIVVDGHSLSYGELERRARVFAARFAGHPAPRVLIGLPQVADAYAAIFGTALAGGFHTPLNLAAPLAKLQRIARLLQPDFIVAAPELAASLGDMAPSALLVDPASVPDAGLFAGHRGRHHLAYVMFTSGSTGDPKGVMVPRAALNHYVNWMSRTFEVVPQDRVSQHPNLAFDISMTDIFGALCHGATLYPLLSERDRLMPARMIAREKITVWNSVPSVVSLMMQASQASAANLASVRLFNFCGEPLLAEQVYALQAVCPQARIQNTYGPTEATIAMTELRLDRATMDQTVAASVAIGDAIPGIGLHLIGGKTPDEGEIAITGPQVADGYWRDPERTLAVFRDVTVDGQVLRGYYTGDWAERRQGQLFFKERIDFQVKIMGFRVELDEVAAAIRDCGWPVACVFKRGEALAAVVEQRPGPAFDEQHLRAALSERVERHAVPQQIKLIDRMPRNDNDKLDRKAAAKWFEAQEQVTG